jgi:hypothetical protein
MLVWITQHRLLMLCVGIAIVVVGVLAALWFFLFRSPGTPVNLSEALDQYQQDQTHAERNDDFDLPASGVYQYRTSGGEQLSLGIDRSFPAITNMVVTDARCAALDWEPLQQHTEGLVLCPQRDGSITVSSSSSTEDIAGMSTNTVIECPARTYFLPPRPLVGSHWHATCHMGEESVAVSGVVVDDASLPIGNKTVRTLHTRLVLDFSGPEAGTNPTDYWILPGDGQIIRQVETVDISQQSGPLGSVRYTERADIALLSLSPKR